MDGIVGEVDVGVGIVEAEEGGGGADVALLVPECLGLSVVAGHEHVGSEVELPAVVEEGPCDVLLDYKGSSFSLFRHLHHSFLYVVYFVGALYAVASVAELPRFEDPECVFLLLFSLVVVVSYLYQGWVFEALADDEGGWDYLEHIRIYLFAVLVQTQEECFFVSQEAVPWKVVVDYLLECD